MNFEKEPKKTFISKKKKAAIVAGAALMTTLAASPMLKETLFKDEGSSKKIEYKSQEIEMQKGIARDFLVRAAGARAESEAKLTRAVEDEFNLLAAKLKIGKQMENKADASVGLKEKYEAARLINSVFMEFVNETYNNKEDYDKNLSQIFNNNHGLRIVRDIMKKYLTVPEEYRK